MKRKLRRQSQKVFCRSWNNEKNEENPFDGSLARNRGGYASCGHSVETGSRKDNQTPFGNRRRYLPARIVGRGNSEPSATLEDEPGRIRPLPECHNRLCFPAGAWSKTAHRCCPCSVERHSTQGHRGDTLGPASVSNRSISVRKHPCATGLSACHCSSRHPPLLRRRPPRKRCPSPQSHNP